MLHLDCQHDPVRLTEHLRGTRESEQNFFFTKRSTLTGIVSLHLWLCNLFFFGDFCTSDWCACLGMTCRSNINYLQR